MKKVKITLLGLLAILGFTAIGISIFVHVAPQFGDNPKGELLSQIKKSPNYKDDRFQNLTPTQVGGDGNMLKILKELLNAKNSTPKNKIPSNFSIDKRESIDSVAYLTWYGHSAFLLEIEGMNILLDPMLGPTAAPVSFFGKRFLYTDPIDLDKLPDEIDAVIFSHDHYDHLDYPSILAIKDRVKHFYMPLGMSAHFLRWGIGPEKLTELDWWESARMGNMEFIATPARHFSGRGISNRFKTLWASWVIRSDRHKLFFSGDGGYMDTFKEIGEKYGPFDLCMLECGQYNAQWPEIHMMPEESVQAHIDLQGKVMMPIHWGAFDLAPHPWIEPVTRAKVEADKRGVHMVTPVIGQRFVVSDTIPSKKWWEGME